MAKKYLKDEFPKADVSKDAADKILEHDVIAIVRKKDTEYESLRDALPGKSKESDRTKIETVVNFFIKLSDAFDKCDLYKKALDVLLKEGVRTEGELTKLCENKHDRLEGVRDTFPKKENEEIRKVFEGKICKPKADPPAENQ